MSAVVLNGKEVVQGIQSVLGQAVSEEKHRAKATLKLTLVEFGEFDDARLYAKAIRRVMEKVGIELAHHHYGADLDRTEAARRLRDLAKENDTTGILILSPVPSKLNHGELVREVPPEKDVEGVRGAGGFLSKRGSLPPTALAVLELIQATGVSIEGKDAVVVGRSEIVGKPAAQLLLERHATVTLCHSRTHDLRSHVARADIVVAAVGKPHIIKGSWIKKGAVVIDAGENRVEGKLVGDVEFDEAAKRAGFISPVPQGVGPVTTWMLVRNLLSLSKARA